MFAPQLLAAGVLLVCSAQAQSLSWSAGFSDDAVFQRSATKGTAVYGFAASAAPVKVTVSASGAHRSPESVYTVTAAVSRWVDDSGCNTTACIDGRTPLPPAHGLFTWRAELKPQPTAGGVYTITAATSGSDANSTITLARVTYGDVYFCSGQSNMALETYYTFSADTLKAEITGGKYSGLRHYMMGSMGNHYEALAPQWVTSQNSLSAGTQFKWHTVSHSASLPSMDPTTQQHSAWAQFSATCMYFGAELVNARAAEGLEDVPIGLIQSAIGGSQIESWMSNETIDSCKNQSLTGGAVPENQGRLYYGMVAPFANYSLAGWVWCVNGPLADVAGLTLPCLLISSLLICARWMYGRYQGENNVYGDMGNSKDGTGYGCSLPAMINLWRSVWSGAASDALFGIATLAAGGSEGPGWHMSGMRWSETANYGRWDNPAMPNSFGAQVYDLGDPWANVGDGNPRKLNQSNRAVIGLRCCGSDAPLAGAWGNCSSPSNGGQCPDKYNCSLPELGPDGKEIPGKYGELCQPWDEAAWAPAMRPLAPLVRANSPSGIAGNNFMGGIHPRLKRPVGRRLAIAAGRMLKKQSLIRLGVESPELLSSSGAMTGPTIAGCRFEKQQLQLSFNASLLGGEGLMLRPFDYNQSDYAQEPGWAGPGTMRDSLGLLVCAVNASDPASGNATTCACSQWNYFKYNSSDPDNPGAFWYCEVGPGYKPPLETIERERRERHALTTARKITKSKIEVHAGHVDWVPQANPFQRQWHATPLMRARASSKDVVEVDLRKLQGLTPLAVRLAWVLFDEPDQTADTCCPGHAAQMGLAPCMPGNCPLYSDGSELPANPFFATIEGGKCHCLEPQTCDA